MRRTLVLADNHHNHPRLARRTTVLLFVLGVFVHALALRAATTTVHFVVLKPPVLATDASGYLSINDAPILAAGLRRIAEYPTFLLYDGPSAGASAAKKAIQQLGLTVRLAPELDTIGLFGHDLDADTGLATPPYAAVSFQPTGDRGLYLLTLRGFPTADWYSTLASMGVLSLEHLPPATYIVAGNRALIEALPRSVAFVRSVFPLSPSMKTALLDATPPDQPSAFRFVSIEAYEGATTASLQPHLTAFADGGVEVADRLGNGRVHYRAHLTDFDISTLALSEQVYAIAPIEVAHLSNERQAQLMAQPRVLSSNPIGGLYLPGGNGTTIQAYDDWLVSNGITNASGQLDLSNTKVALFDTGFDNGVITLAGIHPDFKSATAPFIAQALTEFTPSTDVYDDYTHGTVTASVVTGYPPKGQRVDSSGYRYGLGVAPSVRVATDKVFQCSITGGQTQQASTTAALDHVYSQWAPDVANLSWNYGSCGQYNADAQALDIRTRTQRTLFTVSAGNSDEAVGGCSTVRSPATAKDAIAVGATESYTPDDTVWPNQPTNLDICTFNDCAVTHGALQNARNIPGYSANAGTSFPNVMLKPDLVAPASRTTGPVTRGLTNPPCFTFGVFCNTNIATTGGVTYGLTAGTSFAAPAVAGAAAVVRKWYNKITGANPSPAMTKALLINGARDLANLTGITNGVAPVVHNTTFGIVDTVHRIPDKYQAWGEAAFLGLLNPSASKYLFADEAFVFDRFSNIYSYTFTIADSTKEVHITLVWDDPSKTTAGTPQGTLINILEMDARATRSGTVIHYYGNIMANGVSIENPPQVNDVYNNVQEIVIPAGSFPNGTVLSGDVTVLRLGGDVNPNENPQVFKQDFALVVSNTR